jgi:hypothetical protein
MFWSSTNDEMCYHCKRFDLIAKGLTSVTSKSKSNQKPRCCYVLDVPHDTKNLEVIQPLAQESDHFGFGPLVAKTEILVMIQPFAKD